MTKNTRKTGNIGESVVCRYLIKRGYLIKERNYWKKWGEIDIVAEKNHILCFVEVKSVSKETITDVAHEIKIYNPEELVHSQKLKRLSRIVQTYLLEKTSDDVEWQFDIAAVFLATQDKKAYVRYMENVVL